jgi:dipeptidyl aminopeptidase/acylaminoacyl peptidase
MTTTSNRHETDAAQRTTVRIPTPSGDEIEAWLYRPEGDGPHPAVVMAHGFAAVKAGGLAPFAEAFRRQGIVAIPFDYRHWGGSSGEPRDVTSVPAQRADYHTVIDWAVAHPDIDETRVFIWGTSFSGLHAVELAATDDRLRGAARQQRPPSPSRLHAVSWSARPDTGNRPGSGRPP